MVMMEEEKLGLELGFWGVSLGEFLGLGIDWGKKKGTRSCVSHSPLVY